MSTRLVEDILTSSEKLEIRVIKNEIKSAKNMRVIKKLKKRADQIFSDAERRYNLEGVKATKRRNKVHRERKGFLFGKA